MQDEEGTKFSFSLEGRVSKEKLLKVVDALELIDLPLEPLVKKHDGSLYSKVLEAIDECFMGIDFSSSDVARVLEEKYGLSLKLSTISTYLARLSEQEYLRRERFGNSWVYRRNYIKSRST